MLLTLLAILIAALVVLGMVGKTVPRIALRAGVGGVCVLMVVLAVVALASDAGSAAVELPIGPPGATMHLALDPLAASFLFLVFLVIPCAGADPLPLAAMGLTLVAGDGFTLTVGLLLLGATGSLRTMAAVAVCLIVALALAGPLSDFAALRAAPPEGWRATGVLLLALAGAGALSRVSAVLAGYVVLRVLFDLSGPVQPLWWGVPLLLAGAAIAAIGSLRAAIADTFHAVLSLSSLPLFGMAAMALGVALFARAADLPSATSQALDAAWLALVGQLLCRTLLLLVARAVESGAGTRRLDRLGGLIHGMPVTAASCLVGLLTTAALPPGLGFAAFWLLFQSLLTAARIGELWLRLLVVCVTVIAASSVGLSALAAVRLFGVTILGRPRTPRTAVAEEPPRPIRLVVGGLAAVTALLGVLPALALLAVAGWTKTTESSSFAVLRTGGEALGYSPLGTTGVLAVVAIALVRLLRRTGEQQRREAGWTGGFAAPPSWLPFGDPTTQYGPASFIESLRRVLTLLPPIAPVQRRISRCRDVLLRAATALMAP